MCVVLITPIYSFSFSVLFLMNEERARPRGAGRFQYFSVLKWEVLSGTRMYRAGASPTYTTAHGYTLILALPPDLEVTDGAIGVRVPRPPGGAGHRRVPHGPIALRRPRARSSPEGKARRVHQAADMSQVPGHAGRHPEV